MISNLLQFGKLLQKLKVGHVVLRYIYFKSSIKSTFQLNKYVAG